MINPIYQEGEELLLNPFGSKRLGAGAYTAVNSSEFVAQEDTIISVLTGGDAAITENNIDYKTSMNLGSVTLKKGALIVAPVGEAFKSITIDSGVIIAYNCVTGGIKPPLVSILDFDPINIWDSEHVTKVGNVTTCEDFNDVGVRYNLANPTASSQPTLNTSSSNFNNLPSLTFNGSTDYVRKTIQGYRENDTSGMFIAVYRSLDATQTFISSLTISNSSSNGRYISNSIDSNTLRCSIVARAAFRSFRGSTLANNTNPIVSVIGSNSSNYKMFINSDLQTITTISGSNDGAWLSANRDTDINNITIGALERVGLLYSNIEWCFSGYFPYVDDATTLEIIAFLQTKYEIPNLFNFGNALKFDGTNDSVTTGGSVGNSATKLTLSFWAKRPSNGVNTNIGSLTSSNNGWWFNWYTDNNMYISFRNSSTNSAYVSNTVNVGEWVHILVVYDGTEAASNDRCSMYVNGVEQSLIFSGTQPTSLSSTAGDNFELGSLGGGFFAPGELDEVAVWTGVAGTGQNAIDLYNDSNGALASSVIPSPNRYYRLNESGADLVAIDSGSDSQNGTLINFTRPPEFWVPH